MAYCGLLLVAVCPLMAGDRMEIQLGPSIGFHSGTTSYEFLIRQQAPDPQQIQQVFTVRSKLEFPTDATMIGLNFRLRPKSDIHKWSLNSAIATNVTDPNKVMTDSDWEGITNYFDVTQFSYTESDVQMTMIKADLDFSMRLLRAGTFGFSLMGGVQYQRIDQDIIGYDGWYLPFDSSAFRFLDTKVPQSGTGTVLTYRLTTYQPYAGVRIYVDPESPFEAEADFGLGPVLFSDRDDHLLRYKLSTADGDGLGIISSVRGDYRIREGKTYSYVLGFSAELQHASVNGAQKQTWYADEIIVDPSTGDTTVVVPKGTTIGGLPHEIKNTFYTLGISFGVRF